MSPVLATLAVVTALNLDLGGRIWWPSKLDRDPVIDPADPPARTEEWQPVG